MKRAFLFSLIILATKLSEGQEAANPPYAEGGLTINFLYKVAQKSYGGPLGASIVYDVQNLKPLPGFVFGLVSNARISKVIFFRYGGLVSYHVSSMALNSTTTEDVYGLTDKKENIKTRFRNLYVQLPLELGGDIGEKKSLSLFGGIKLGYRMVNESNWNYIHTEYNYQISSGGTLILVDSVGPNEERSKLATHSSDIAAEIGFSETLSENLTLEERVDASLFTTMDFGDASYAPTLHQVTGEIVLCWKLNKRPKNN